MKVVFTFKPPEELKNDLQTDFPDIDFHFYANMKDGINDLEDAEILVTYGEDLIEEHIEKAKKLQWIMVTSAGLELMPLGKIKEKNLLLTNAKGIHKIPMAEYTMGLLLDYTKNVRLLRENQQKRLWDKGIPMFELHGQTVTIFGAGAIGNEIARLAKAFGMKVLGVNSRGQLRENYDAMYTLDTSEEEISNADFIVSILPSTNETKGYFTKEHFQKMKNSAVFINIGRGDVVEESILREAIETKEIAHAYLDVFEIEPLPTESPLWGMKNVTVTPHISSTTKKYLPRAIDIFKTNLHTYINKNQNYINRIDPERGY